MTVKKARHGLKTVTGQQEVCKSKDIYACDPRAL